MDLEQCCRPRHRDVEFDGHWLKNNILSLLVTECRNTLGFATGLAPLTGAHGGVLAFFWKIRVLGTPVAWVITLWGDRRETVANLSDHRRGLALVKISMCTIMFVLLCILGGMSSLRQATSLPTIGLA
ncbi:hypothetical protein EJ07DRAFT_159452 [Lizonia empirigonia]|nr:hypothetical protein EJ07DRAFT_159452 [Lizonia empirigonia]